MNPHDDYGVYQALNPFAKLGAFNPRCGPAHYPNKFLLIFMMESGRYESVWASEVVGVKMTVEQTTIIDIISLDKRTGQVILTVSDHLEWNDSARHQEILQAKLNAYLAFVESGEILKKYPDAMERTIVFKVVLKFKPDLEGRAFLCRVQKVIENAGFAFMCDVFAESYDN